MSEQPESNGPGDVADPKQPLPAPVRMAIAAGLMLLLLLIVAGVGVINARKTKEQAFRQSVSALAAALSEQVLLADRSGAKATQTLQKIAQDSGYKSISLVDSRGRVFASTDRTRENQDMPGFKEATDAVKLSWSDGHLTGTRGVFLGSNNRIGAIEVQLSP